MFRILFVFSVCLPTFLLASAEFVPLQERAEGQSLTGATLQNDSLYSNPASGAFQNVYSLDGTYVLAKGFAVSILDTRTSSMGGALGYFRMPVEGTDEMTQGAKVSLCAKSSESIAFGISGKMIWSPSLTESPTGRTHEKLTDVDVGALANLGMVQFGSTLKNALGGNEALEAKRELALGGRINWNQLLFLSITAVSNLSEIKPYQYGVGAEFMTPYYFSIKGGYRYRLLTTEANQSTWSVGLSFISPKFNLHYALEMPQYLNGKNEHIVGLTVFL